MECGAVAAAGIQASTGGKTDGGLSWRPHSMALRCGGATSHAICRLRQIPSRRSQSGLRVADLAAIGVGVGDSVSVTDPAEPLQKACLRVVAAADLTRG